jgi:single-strand DNA-binding protein
MGSVNKVILVGNLGRDVEIRYTSSGTAVATLSLATTDVWKDKDGKKQEKTEWHKVVVWGKTAETLQPYLLKGRQIYIDGSLQTRQWDDKDGIKRYTTETKADKVVLMGGRGGEATAGGGGGSKTRDDDLGQPVGPPGPSGFGESSELTEDDIPF